MPREATDHSWGTSWRSEDGVCGERPPQRVGDHEREARPREVPHRVVVERPAHERQREDGRVREDQIRDALRVAQERADPRRPAPVVDDQRHALEVEVLDEFLQVVGVVHTDHLVVGRIRAAEADVIHRDDAERGVRPGAEFGDGLAPGVRTLGIAVDEDDGCLGFAVVLLGRGCAVVEDGVPVEQTLAGVAALGKFEPMGSVLGVVVGWWVEGSVAWGAKGFGHREAIAGR